MVPPNIAPLNFLVEEAGLEYRVLIHAAAGEGIRLASRGPSIVIPPLPWRELLEKNRGGRIELAIYVKGEDNAWRRFDTIENTSRRRTSTRSRLPAAGTAGQPLPQHGDYQRNLENYDESPVLTNDSFGGGW